VQVIATSSARARSRRAIEMVVAHASHGRAVRRDDDLREVGIAAD